tara:strand:- start:12345 stop:14162 length:1818 start_codon:yes stop_codon:yes gene_type:complete
MANEQDRLRVSALEFDSIKNSFKEYLKGQDTFKDYDFEGSAMSILLDVLAYNTHYHAFYNNMTASEMFLDSASIRSSAVSIAKQLGYTPRSKTSSYANIKLTITNSSQAANISIPAYTKFTTSLDGTSYSFYNLNNLIAKPSAFDSDGNITHYESEEFEIYEGKVKTQAFTNDAIITDQRFLIENTDIDTSTMKVHVKASIDTPDEDKVLWSKITNITELSSLTESYAVEESVDGFFELRFGDGVIGKKLQDGNVIEVTYLQTNGELLNGAGKTFTTTLGTVTVIDSAIGGGDREDIDSIKFTAPKAFATQERAVTTEDYKALVLRDFPNVETVEAWGGQDNDPPAFGKVFLSIKPKQGFSLATAEKLAIVKSLTTNRNVVGVTPEVVDPDITYLYIDTEVWWKSELSSLTFNGMVDLIRQCILDYRDFIHNLGFRGMFYEVDLANRIKSKDPSITAIIVNTKLQKRLTVDKLGSQKTTIKFHEELFHPHAGHMSILTTNQFQHRELDGTLRSNCELFDDGKGVVKLKYTVDGIATEFPFSVGTIDYEHGVITLNNKFLPLNVLNNELRFTVEPEYDNFCPHQNILLNVDILDTDSIKIKLEDSP